jgi:hypothetical protein
MQLEETFRNEINTGIAEILRLEDLHAIRDFIERNVNIRKPSNPDFTPVIQQRKLLQLLEKTIEFINGSIGAQAFIADLSVIFGCIQPVKNKIEV